MARDVCPSADLNESLGAANQRWKKVYVGEVVEEESNFISRLVTKLASKAAISVSSLSKESIFYRLLSYALDASGVEYNFNNANAWYISFGDLLGGLIIQGGFVTQTVGGTLPVNYPLTGTSRTLALSLAPDATSSNQYTEIPQYISPSKQGFIWYGVAHDNAEHPVNGSWIAMVL